MLATKKILMEAYSVLINKTMQTKHTMSSRKSPGTEDIHQEQKHGRDGGGRERERERERTHQPNQMQRAPLRLCTISHSLISVPPDAKCLQFNRRGMLGMSSTFRGMKVDNESVLGPYHVSYNRGQCLVCCPRVKPQRYMGHNI